MFPDFEKQIHKLERDLNFRIIRNKISAHRDGNLDLVGAVGLWRKITRYNLWKSVRVFERHLRAVFEMYPTEAKLYFQTQMTALKGTLDVNHSIDPPYESFDEPWPSDEVP
jgi:hypothetical protein